MIAPDQIQPGMKVVYEPRDGGLPEYGEVVRLNDSQTMAFVRYTEGVKATSLSDLRVAVGW